MNTKDRVISTCIFCEEPVYREQKTFNLALDRPIRLDLMTHRECYYFYKNKGELKEFLEQNLYDYIRKYEKAEYGKAKKAFHKSRATN